MYLKLLDLKSIAEHGSPGLREQPVGSGPSAFPLQSRLTAVVQRPEKTRKNTDLENIFFYTIVFSIHNIELCIIK
jgi:hypothetical protein